ncbi:MAG TPA: hypothetical protein VJL90_11600 [Pseudorhodoplanes sp.]|nr:hypothetical protein [Pseudorhodoplanes sp.]
MANEADPPSRDTSDHPSIGANESQQARLIRSLAQIAAIWIVSDVGYYFLLPALKVPSGYNAGSVASALYYVFWVGFAVITFWPIYSTWPQYGRWSTFENRLTSYIVWSLSFSGCILFAAYVMPLLPPIHWKESWTPPDVVIATPWYFLPKSIEILFQQLLVVALVLTLSVQQYSLRRISVYSAVLFGGTHIFLAFGGVPIGYVIRFMLAAAAFGFVFPYLLLRVPNGLAYSYVVHWLYYALSAIMPHIFLSSAK